MNTQIIVDHDQKTVLITQTGQGASGDHRMVGPFESIERALDFVGRLAIEMALGVSPWKVRTPVRVENKQGSKYQPVDKPPKRQVFKGEIRAGGKTPTTPPPRRGDD